MPSFAFVPSSAKLVVQAGEGLRITRPQHYLTCKVSLDREDRIRLASKEEFDELEGVVNIKPLPASEAEGSSKVIGAIHYFSKTEDEFLGTQSAVCIVELEIPPAQFAEVLHATRSGRLPSSVNISVADDSGIEYGWEPDGRGKEWDNVKSPNVPVVDAYLTIPFVSSPAEMDEMEEQLSPDLMPPTRAQLTQLGQQVQLLGERVAKQLNVLLTVIVIIAAIFLWFRG